MKLIISLLVYKLVGYTLHAVQLFLFLVKPGIIRIKNTVVVRVLRGKLKLKWEKSVNFCLDPAIQSYIVILDIHWLFGFTLVNFPTLKEKLQLEIRSTIFLRDFENGLKRDYDSATLMSATLSKKAAK